MKQHNSTEFKSYCRSDSVYRLWSRPEGPDQLSSCSGLFLVQNCNILLFLERYCNWRIWPDEGNRKAANTFLVSGDSYNDLQFPAVSGVEMEIHKR